MVSPVQFDYSLSVGNILTIAAILGMGWKTLAFFRPIEKIIIEHNMMWNAFLQEHPELKVLMTSKVRR